jgi:transcriptional regulator with XRE-family HTH domain
MTSHRDHSSLAAPNLGPVETTLGPRIAELISSTRGQLGWSEDELGRRAGVSRSQVSRMIHGHRGHGRIDDAARMLDVMGVRLELAVQPPVLVGAPSQRDTAHARVLAYASRHLELAGLTIAREVPIGADRVRGWIDLLGHGEPSGVVALIEGKGDMYDLGALERQVTWYEREAPWAAQRLGWARPRQVAVLVVALATDHNAEFVRRNRDALRARFPDAVKCFAGIGAAQSPGDRAMHVLAFVDPARRGPAWLLRTPLEPGRPILPYDDARAFLEGRRRS